MRREVESLIAKTDSADDVLTGGRGRGGCVAPQRDGHAGGCDNIRLVIGGTPGVQTSVFHAAD
jgi:hypothetical protein